MKITYGLDDGLFEVGTLDGLVGAVGEFMIAHGVNATVEISGDEVIASIEDPNDIDANEDINVAIGFCNSRRFGKAKKVLNELLEKKPYWSEAYRLLAQIEMEDKSFDEAIKLCIKALKFNPRNTYALILAGNLFSRDKNDAVTGASYFRRVLEIDPSSPLAAVNYAALLVKTDGDIDEAVRLYRKAIDLQPDYFNAYYGLACVYLERKEFQSAFDVAQVGLLKGVDRPENPAPLKEAILKVLLDSAKTIVEDFGSDVVDRMREELREAGGIDVRVEEDTSISVPAKMELANRYGREFHRLVYNPRMIGSGHQYCIMHEIEKQMMNVESEKSGYAVRFTENVNGEKNFLEKTLPYVTDKFRRIVPDGEMEVTLKSLLHGLGGQLMNTPLDIFVTKRIHDKYPSARAIQVLGVYQLIGGAVKSVAQGVEFGFPKNIVRLNRVLNAVAMMQYRDLFGLDCLGALNISEDEADLVKSLYSKACLAVERDYPGAEWDLVKIFVDDLNLRDYFVVLGADDSLTESLRKEESVATFRKNVKENSAIGATVMMFMVEAIKRLRVFPVDEVKKVAIEIAMLGMNGISPSKMSGYSVPSLGGEDMGGCRMLAYYYVSWAMAIPEKVTALGLPFAEEYEMAKKLAEK